MTALFTRGTFHLCLKLLPMRSDRLSRDIFLGGNCGLHIDLEAACSCAGAAAEGLALD